MSGPTVPESNRKRDGDERAGAVGLFTHEGYRYTVVTIANGAVPRTVEAELWYHPPRAEARGDGWKYFGRRGAGVAAEAREQVERDFKAWVEGRLEADGGPR